MNIGKDEAATRQLDVAIELFFENRDILAVFTVANAASVIFADLVALRNPKIGWDRLGSEANGLALGQWFAAIRRTPNFLKHARNDPDAFVEIKPQDVDHILFIACLNHGSLLDRGQAISVTQSVFQLWYLSWYAELLIGSQQHGRLDELVANARAVVGNLPVDREQAIAVGADLLRHQARSP